MSIVIVDYGAGNLRSVQRAVERAGFQPLVSNDPNDVLHARAVIVPGVGAASDTMRHLRDCGMIEPIRTVIADGKPFLGICMGLQALLSFSEEGSGQSCLDVVPGTVRRLPAGQKVPHMGWNEVRQVRPHPIFQNIPDRAYFYFVHSYYADPKDYECVIGETEYGVQFPSAIARDNLVATQFHPEKSGTLGLQIYSNFLTAALRRVTI